ncbi:c-type cytochrome biogenesis protein CcmI [Vibrio sp. UCD-FRSSP16_10]|uniref:c-type cytochrome biogenesis protein CcmI n=1 Tax=unclassified Vibrio TaxID=2614977 RepID=UPI0007FF0A84|nr:MULTISPECIES: c-type cytochrome biogenesis protein CcmI [unclassified Vibrio]OBT15864.1 c-type cytochrome biogenesis protein CcmI [Vibrio sp. UCD-FRSSP16_10]OBT17758.1 c-type cytochrome biogenesis protein CcmI [Vibrio sp. UCD-FRSSP16_30]
MTLFWITTLVIVLFAAALIIIPLIRKQAINDAERRDELNKVIFKERVAELAVEDDEGIVVDKEELIVDLKQALLDDIPENQQLASTKLASPILVAVVSAVLLLGVSYGFYAKYGAINEVQQWQKVSANLPALSKKLMDAHGEALSEDELNDMTLALRTSLHRNPDDATGWLLLGRIGLANRDIETAMGAMKRARKLEPNNVDIQLGLAQSLTLSNDEVDHAEAERLLHDLLRQDYVDLRVFSLLAFSAFEKGDYAGAVRYWRTMQQLIGPEDSRYDMLERSINSARSKLGGTAEAIPGVVRIGISVVDGAQLPQQGVLIVSVHRADGSPMPVAAARYGLGSFPRMIMMDDGNSMLEGLQLSSLDSFIVRARIDTDGDVSTKEGDWYGESAVTMKGEDVTLIINSQY